MKYSNLTELFKAIADAIRGKTGGTENIVAEDFPEAIEGITTSGNSPEADLALKLWEERSKSTTMGNMFSYCSSLTTVPLFDTSNATNMGNMFSYCTSLTIVPLFDTSKVTSMNNMFYGCRSLTTVPLFDTSKVTNMNNMFGECTSLTTVPLFDTSKVTSMNSMFSYCSSLTTVPLFDTSKVTNMSGTFIKCSSLTTVPLFDTRNTTNISSIFSGCINLTDCYLRNIKCSLQVSDGSDYGNLLTLDSLIHLIKECRDTGSQKLLTIGRVNLKKLADTYVRTVEITDEMRAEDDLIDEKLPFELCESTDEGAMHIVDYAAAKHWTVK